MFRFNPAMIRFELAMVRKVTAGLHSSITIVDQQTKKLKSIEVPYHVANRAQKDPAFRRMLVPIPCAIMHYGNRIVTLERFVHDVQLEIRTVADIVAQNWVPKIESVARATIIPLATSGEKWYCDGRFVYQFAHDDITEAIESSAVLSEHSTFYDVPCTTYDMKKLSEFTGDDRATRHCIGYLTDDRAHRFITPPLWRDLSTMQSAKRQRAAAELGNDTNVVIDDSFLFDRLDESFGVNLQFALRTAKFVAQHYGVEHIAPFNLADVMVDLDSVNLVKLPKHVKATHDTKLPFTHLTAWLIGMMSRSSNFDTFVDLCEYLKYLTVRGMFLRDSVDPTRIYGDNRNIGRMPPRIEVPTV